MNLIHFLSNGNSNLSIIQLNITSIYNNLVSSKVYLEAYKSSFNLIVLSEAYHIYNKNYFKIPRHEIITNVSFHKMR